MGQVMEEQPNAEEGDGDIPGLANETMKLSQSAVVKEPLSLNIFRRESPSCKTSVAQRAAQSGNIEAVLHLLQILTTRSLRTGMVIKAHAFPFQSLGDGFWATRVIYGCSIPPRSQLGWSNLNLDFHGGENWGTHFQAGSKVYARASYLDLVFMVI
ncbi:hypothetical protein K438DRAFT_1784217 [Mycena galopus ATCC 62051]|nr:hypothetical protein K438DRAFT_1784217 [Mycena galopus ATCC 62051]